MQDFIISAAKLWHLASFLGLEVDLRANTRFSTVNNFSLFH